MMKVFCSETTLVGKTFSDLGLHVLPGGVSEIPGAVVQVDVRTQEIPTVRDMKSLRSEFTTRYGKRFRGISYERGDRCTRVLLTNVLKSVRLN